MPSDSQPTPAAVEKIEAERIADRFAVVALYASFGDIPDEQRLALDLIVADARWLLAENKRLVEKDVEHKCGSFGGERVAGWGCGKAVNIETGVRCFDCKVYFCNECAPAHFKRETQMPIGAKIIEIVNLQRQVAALHSRLASGEKELTAAFIAGAAYEESQALDGTDAYDVAGPWWAERGMDAEVRIKVAATKYLAEAHPSPTGEP